MKNNDELEWERFEAHMRNDAAFMEFWLDRDSGGNYYWDQTRYEWQGWLARSKQQAASRRKHEH
ncbi:hypothetical protein [[Curtobacterium] plantarum]|uniref:DUF905 domain-containing protein n=1 Tax=[Curtobacterium] plantarum TaxID=221276 RepID=A0ABT9T6D7_9GAMM|nr:hypothetical protein [[Curtobacterium] plantarum]MDQ0019029.1 hypothetical protein [[Curtobacterium] plantarum]